MIGPGEVDDELQPEVIEECSKYGEVNNCLIFEVCGLYVYENEATHNSCSQPCTYLMTDPVQISIY